VSGLSHYALFVGLRYSFSRKRSRFTGLIASISMLGMVLGVATLITVLSVMNGFAAELRGRILSLVPHGYVQSADGPLSEWSALAERLRKQAGVVGVAPFIDDQVILAGPRQLRGARLTAIDPAQEAQVSRVGSALLGGDMAELLAEPFSIVLGSALAAALEVGPGDTVEVTLPRLTITPLGTFPRSKRLTVSGLFRVNAQPDSQQAYVSLPTGQRLLALGEAVDGLQVATRDLMAAPGILADLALALPDSLVVTNWTQTQGSLFRAVRMEKLMVGLLLLSVVAVAAFNIVSTLVMSVAEKRRDIAVLRTLGARASGIVAIFVAHGLGLALFGIALGALLGVVLSWQIAAVTATLENWLGVKLFDPAVYFISELPARLMWGDVSAVVLAALALSLLATLYPAWRASRIAPAEVLRYE
jgi:lipoprotein-releasing system permease protein